MRYYKTRAFVLGSQELSETDKIVTYFSARFGKIKGVLKGARRPKSRFHSGADLLMENDIIFYSKPEKELKIINQSRIVNQYTYLYKDLRLITFCSIIAELIDTLTAPDDPLPRLYSLTGKTLKNFDSGNQPYTHLFRFIFQALNLTGFKLSVNLCKGCNRQLNPGMKLFFLPSDGGLICDSCIYDRNIKLDPVSR